jgi:hypothetical protein
MSQYQVKSADRPIKCISCGRIIGQGFIVEGTVQLLCKCGVKNKIEATLKPEGRRGWTPGEFQDCTMLLPEKQAMNAGR